MPALDRATRFADHPLMAPPGTHREPMTRSGRSGPAMRLSSFGRSTGRCEPSASIWRMNGYPCSIPQPMPSTYAVASPDFAGRCRTWRRSSPSRRVSTHSPVPSGDESSTISTCAPGTCAQMSSRIVGSVDISLYVGITIRVWSPEGDGEKGTDSVMNHILPNLVAGCTPGAR